MITAEQVKKLNKKIEELNAQGNRAKAKLEVLEGNLSQSLDDYKSTYGVDLRGNTLKGTASNIQKELQAVEAAVQEEYDLRMAVVAAIENGNIEEANRLLGVQVVEEADDPEDEEVIVETAPVETVTTGSVEDGNDFGVDIEDTEDDFNGLDGDGTVGEDDDTNPASFGFSGLDIDIDDDDDEAPVAKPKAEGTKPSGSKKSDMGESVDSAVQDLTGGFEGIDIDDDDLEDFGFGSMLSGTKFSIDD